MSSARGSGFPRGRGRGSAQPARGRGASTSRGRVYNNPASQRGTPTSRARASYGQAGRGLDSTRGNAPTQAASARASFGGAKTGGSWQERYQALMKAREREREDAIRQGLIADPDKPRALSEAITLVGTCQDMCAEYERVQRVVQDDVWPEEKGTDQEPDETRMVKKFRRSAAGLEEQLPSDLRSPQVLKRTCDYLFDEVVGNASSLAQVHYFVWDRTRAIRNDFSIQQLSKLDELRIAVDCYERIARFHLLSMHQLASPQKLDARYNWQQEREQLDRTLLSLMQFYDDTRGRIAFPNEAEFRAYCVIFQLRSPTPDLEDSVQAWPRHILRDKRVRKALDLYAAGCSTMGSQGPLNPKASHLIARQDWQRFWVLLASNETSYIMGCVAEVYFNSIRQILLNALFRTFRANTTIPTPDWTLDALCELFAFDNEEEVQTYCQYFGFTFKDREDGQSYLDLSSVPGRVLPQPSAEMPNQLNSSLVESKRHGRTLPAVINGMTVRQAQDAGLVEEEHDEGMEDVDGDYENGMPADAGQAAEDDEESLFIPEANNPNITQPGVASNAANGLDSQAKPSPFKWGKPSPFSAPAPAAQPSDSNSKPKFDFLGGGAKTEGTDKSSTTGFNFLSAASKPAEKAPTAPSGFNFLQAGAKASDAVPDSKPTFTWPGPTTAATALSGTPAAKFDFTGGAALGNLSKGPQNAGGQTKSDGGGATKRSAQTEAASQSNGMFSRPAQDWAGGSNPFNFTPPIASKPASPERSPAIPSQSPSGPVPNVPKPATVESAPLAPDLPDSPQNPFLQAPPKSPETAPSFPSQPKQAQPHFIAPSANVPPSLSNTPPSPSNLNTGLRRPSTSTDTRPKKPSPLSNSFTATDEGGSAAREPSATFPPPKPIVTEKLPTKDTLPKPSQTDPTSSTEESQLKTPVPFKRPRWPPEEAIESFDVTVTRIAKELVDDPVSGYLKQYVEYRASQIITSVQEQIAAEKMKLRLSELRISTLYRKYFKRWVSLIWQRRLVKSGKDRRQRRRKRLEDGFDDRSSYGDESVRDSRPGSVMGTSSWKDHQENVDAMFQRTINSRSLARPVLGDHQAKAGGKRPSSSHGENGIAPRASAHKRLKSTSHVDERGRVVKPTVSSHPDDDILKRSSFLGFSVNGRSPPSRNTTKSNYFRLKAMGVHRADELSAPRGTKRSRTESTQPAATSPPRLRQSMSAASSPEESTTKSLMPPPSSTLSRAQKAKEEDDVLFARIRAARESLTIGTVYMKSEIEKDEEHRRSLSASQSSNESPSMIKARTEARARASRAGSPERDVPAYRLRESKFVPREQYGRAIEKAKEMRESRSRDTSRPTSRPASRLGQSAQQTSTQALDFSFDPATDNSENKPHSLTNGYSSRTSAAKSPSIERKPASFSPVAPPAPFSFATHITELPESNPFLQPTVQATIDSPKTNALSPLAAHEVPKHGSSQPTFGSKPAFGAQSGFGATSTYGSQHPFSPQQPVPGFQSAFGSQSTANPNPFGSAFASPPKPAFGNQQAPSSFAAPQDQTVRPEMIDQSLKDSFGAHEEHDYTQTKRSSYDPVLPQQSSYMHTQTNSLLPDDADDQEDDPTAEVDHLQANGFGTEEVDEELLDQSTEEEGFQPPYGHANPFSLLANQHDDDQSRAHSQATGDEMYDQDQFDQDEQQMGNGFDSQEDFSNDGDVGFADGYYGGRDEEGADGDIDEGSGVEEEADEEGDGSESAEEDEDEDEEEESAPPQPWQKVEYADPWTAKPTPNPTLQGMGTTEDAPIELDSD